MGKRLSSFFQRMDESKIALGEARMQLKLGISRARAATIDDTPELLAKAERVLNELIRTKDLFQKRR
jgi:hypothetical protein